VPTKVREAIRTIEADGWYQVKSKSGAPSVQAGPKLGRVPVAGKPSDDLAPKTFESILKQAGIKK
jgi:predicted RNA binding protein YcfA (HicA-like mRNA interferase family)